VQAKEFALGVEGFVGGFPEFASLPEAAGFGVADGGDGESEEGGELRLGEVVGAAAGCECC
jgi:hypothetical protein